jgi:hypothetical protein
VRINIAWIYGAAAALICGLFVILWNSERNDLRILAVGSALAFFAGSLTWITTRLQVQRRMSFLVANFVAWMLTLGWIVGIPFSLWGWPLVAIVGLPIVILAWLGCWWVGEGRWLGVLSLTFMFVGIGYISHFPPMGGAFWPFVELGSIVLAFALIASFIREKRP